MTHQIIKDFEAKFKSKNLLNFKVGDTISVSSKIIEGEKERLQIFTGIVVAIKGKGLSQTFTLYRNAYGCSMERIFLLHSPRIAKIEIEKKGKVRKSKLYYIRGQSGKRAKVTEQMGMKEVEADIVLLQESIAPAHEENQSIEASDEAKPHKVSKKKSEEKEVAEKPKKKASKKEKSEE